MHWNDWGIFFSEDQKQGPQSWLEDEALCIYRAFRCSLLLYYYKVRDLMKEKDGRFCPLCCHSFRAKNFSSRGKELGKYKNESSSVPPPLKIRIKKQRWRLVVQEKLETHFVHEKAGFLWPAAAPVRASGLKGPVLGSPLGESWRCSKKKMQLAGWILWPSLYSWRLPLTVVGEDLQGFWTRLMSL